MNILIIEDEPPAADRLKRMIAAVQPGARFLDVIDSVASAAAWFGENSAPDLVFIDVRLSDGLAFDIFDLTTIDAPIIFCTAHDEYALEAFRVAGIDYLLKPVDEGELARAFAKLEALDRQLAPRREVLRQLGADGPKTRFLVRAGAKLLPIETAAIGAFKARHRGVEAHLTDGRSYFIDYTLAELETLLDRQAFFRISRQMIAAAAAIEAVHAEGGRWAVLLKAPMGEFPVSRDRAADFRRWIEA